MCAYLQVSKKRNGSRRHKGVVASPTNITTKKQYHADLGGEGFAPPSQSKIAKGLTAKGLLGGRDTRKSHLETHGEHPQRKPSFLQHVDRVGDVENPQVKRTEFVGRADDMASNFTALEKPPTNRGSAPSPREVQARAAAARTAAAVANVPRIPPPASAPPGVENWTERLQQSFKGFISPLTTPQLSPGADEGNAANGGNGGPKASPRGRTNVVARV